MPVQLSQWASERKKNPIGQNEKKNITISAPPWPRTDAITATIASMLITKAPAKLVPESDNMEVGPHIAKLHNAQTPMPDKAPINCPIM